MPHKIDKLDLKILEALQLNARISNLALSETISLSASACLARVQKLRDAGYIDREISILSLAKVGSVLNALLEVTLANHKLSDHKKFEEGISDVPEIIMAMKVSGRFDYILAVMTLDMPSLNALSDDLLEGTLGITKLVTLPVLDIAKPFSGFPISMLQKIV